jgi:hypothetical protein
VKNAAQPTFDPSLSNWLSYAPMQSGTQDNLQQAAGAIYTCTFSALPYRVTTNADVQNDTLQQGELGRYVIRDMKQVGEQLQTLGLFRFVTAPSIVRQNGVDQCGQPVYTASSPALPQGCDALTPQGPPVPTPPAIQCPYRQLEYTWKYVPDPIYRVIQTADRFYGTVNKDGLNGTIPFDMLYGQFPPETLLFVGAEYTRIPGTTSSAIQSGQSFNILWDIKFKFVYRTQGWNVAYRPTWLTPGRNVMGWPDWDRVVNVITRLPPYRSESFYQLFKV